MTDAFAPKGEEVIKEEVLEDLGIEYEGNEEQVNKVVQRRLKDEEFKASVHGQKTKAQEAAEKRKEFLTKAGFDPETGEKLKTNVGPEIKNEVKNEGLSAKDLIALRDVHEEDLDFLLDEAKLRGKSISELKKDPYTKAVLNVRAEERRTAEAAASAPSRQRSQNTTSDKVLDDFNRGILPETEEAGKALAEAQFKNLLKGTK